MGSKKASGKHYVSKNERPNVSRRVRNAIRRENRQNPSIRSILDSYNHRSTAIERPHDPKYKGMKEKYEFEDAVDVKASALMNKFGKYGMTWSAAVMAVKTDRIGEVEAKWAQKVNA